MAKQAELTGMEGNRKLQDLHDAAEDYVDIRDKRMKLTPEEVEAKAKVPAPAPPGLAVPPPGAPATPTTG